MRLKKSMASFYTSCRKNKGLTILWMLIFLVLIFLRAYDFERNVMFIGDQGRDALVIYDIMTFNKFTLIGAPSSIGMVFLGPFYYYLIAPFLPLFGWNPAGLAFGVLLFSIIGSLIAVRITYKELGMTAAIVFALFLAGSFSLIDFARFSWNPNLLPYFSFVTIWLFARWSRHKTNASGMLLGIMFGLSIQLHYLGLIVSGAFGIMYLGTLIKSSRHAIITSLRSLISPIGGFLLTLTPLILFDLRHQFINARQLLTLLSSGSLAQTDSGLFTPLLQTAAGFVHHVLGQPVPEHVAILVLLVWIVCAVFVYRRTSSLMAKTHVVVGVVYFVVFSFISSPKIPHYFTPVYLTYYLIFAGAIAAILPPKRYLRIGVIAAVAIAFFSMNAPRYFFFTQKPNDQIGNARRFAEEFLPYIKAEPIQIVTIPFTESHGHFRYFLRLNNIDVLPEISPETPQELYVLCFTPCNALGDPQWQIAAFPDKALGGFFSIGDVKIYKIIRKPIPTRI